MPNCFQLTRKGETEPTSLSTIDEELCTHLGVPVHPRLYVAGWFDSVGFLLAMGKTFPEIRAVGLHGDQIPRIIDYLEANFTSDSWTEVGRSRS